MISSSLAWRIPWSEEPVGVTKSQKRLTLSLHFINIKVKTNTYTKAPTCLCVHVQLCVGMCSHMRVLQCTFVFMRAGVHCLHAHISMFAHACVCNQP